MVMTGAAHFFNVNYIYAPVQHYIPAIEPLRDSRRRCRDAGDEQIAVAVNSLRRCLIPTIKCPGECSVKIAFDYHDNIL